MTIAAQTVKPINPPQWDWEMEIVNKNKPSFIYLFIYALINIMMIGSKHKKNLQNGDERFERKQQ